MQPGEIEIGRDLMMRCRSTAIPLIAGATSHAGMSQGARALQSLGLGPRNQKPAKKAPHLAAVPEDSVPAVVEKADGMPCTPVKQPGTGGSEICIKCMAQQCL